LAQDVRGAERQEAAADETDSATAARRIALVVPNTTILTIDWRIMCAIMANFHLTGKEMSSFFIDNLCSFERGADHDPRRWRHRAIGNRDLQTAAGARTADAGVGQARIAA
jgi:hypothetical protein